MWRQLLGVVLALGPLYLGVSFGLPLVLAGGAVASWKESQGLAWVLAGAAAVAAIIALPPYFQAVEHCREIEERRSFQQALEQLTGEDRVTADDLAYVENKCADLPGV